MILETVKVLDVQSIGDMPDGIEAGITADAYPFIFELVSKRLYSNPIGSIIREITSNCFDSHVEAKVDEPVIISQSYSIEEGYFIEFKDVGIGLSPERVQTVYMNYFSSTKRGDNTQIGAFGIGSKTPLAYADLFYITTIYDNIQYEYLFHKGSNKPTLELLNQEEVEEHNGTTIKIGIERNDLNRFKDELKLQLAYFDNVYFKKWEVSNDYHIYEGKNFKFRSDIDQHNTAIHLCIGKVRYEIDFSKVNIPTDSKKIPIAVKFEIGELQITPSRETVIYNDESKKLILDRVKLAVDEIVALFEDQNPEIEDLKDYIRVGKDAARLYFDKDKNHALFIWASSGLAKSYKFKPLSGLAIKKVPDNMFFMWKIMGTINHGIFTSNKYDIEVNNGIIANGKYIIFKKEDRISSYTNLYINRSLRHEYINVIARREIKYEDVSKLLDIKESSRVGIIGKAKTISSYIKIIEGIVYENGLEYSNLRPSDEWVNEYKKSVKESSAAWIRKKNQKVFVRDAARDFRGVEYNEYYLQNRTGILVYGFKEDKDVLSRIYNTVVCNKENIKILSPSKLNKHGRNKRQEAFMVLQVSQAAEKGILGAYKTVYWEDFIKSKFWRKLETAYYINNSLDDFSFGNIDMRKLFIRAFKEDYQKVRDSIKPYYSGNSYFNDRITTNKLIPDMLKPLNRFINKHIPPVELPMLGLLNNYIPSRGQLEYFKEYVEYLKYKKVKLNTIFYLKTVEQLLYEYGVRKILEAIKNPKIEHNLLTYNLNQIENVS